MKVFKFGGASVKDAKSIENVARILASFSENLVIVVSAMGKTTNAMEMLSRLAYDQKPYQKALDEIIAYHQTTTERLGLKGILNDLFDSLSNQLRNSNSFNYDQFYDTIVPFGELFSTTILSEFLKNNNIINTWMNASDFIRTDSRWMDATVDLDETCGRINSFFQDQLNTGHIITQGFIGANINGQTTTLGREGSDYTGALIANCLNAEGLWIWKDVPGVLTADPKEFPAPVLLRELSYYEAIEMTYYGASVIHPKTIQPLQTKGIPLYVKSFEHPEAAGTSILSDSITDEMPAITVLKRNQLLLSISTKDFSFMAEDHLSKLYGIFSDLGVKINLMQTAALSLSVCVDNRTKRQQKLLDTLQEHFSVLINDGLLLITIRHYTENELDLVKSNPNVLLTQQSRQTLQIVLRE